MVLIPEDNYSIPMRPHLNCTKIVLGVVLPSIFVYETKLANLPLEGQLVKFSHKNTSQSHKSSVQAQIKNLQHIRYAAYAEIVIHLTFYTTHNKMINIENLTYEKKPDTPASGLSFPAT